MGTYRYELLVIHGLLFLIGYTIPVVIDFIITDNVITYNV